MKPAVKWAAAASVLLLGVALIGLQQRWWGLEPATGGRTVTEWLDRMALFEAERRMDRTGENSFFPVRDPAVVTNDPALLALVRLGPRAVPVLRQRLIEPPQPTTLARWRNRLDSYWERIRNLGRPVPAVTAFSPPYRSSFHRARQNAAMLGLLALRKENGGGLRLALETLAAAGTNEYGNFVAYPGTALVTAVPGLPHRRAELAEDVFALLSDTNALRRRLAAESAREFREELPDWKATLIHLADEDADDQVRRAALRSLTTQLRGDPEVVALCRRTLADTNHWGVLRGSAAAGLSMAGPAAREHLPLLRAVMEEADARHAQQPVEEFRFLRSEARRAIEHLTGERLR
jgi:hypothetical protein